MLAALQRPKTPEDFRRPCSVPQSFDNAYLCTHTEITAETEDHIRIISMRKADKHEHGNYRENLT